MVTDDEGAGMSYNMSGDKFLTVLSKFGSNGWTPKTLLNTFEKQ